MTPAANFVTGTAGVVDTGGKFATGVNNTSGKYQTADILVNLKEKIYLYVNCTTQRCSKKI
jgi:hypothetical protein